MKQNIINIYKKLVLKIYNQGSVKISNKTLGYFIERYQEVLSEDFIWDYICFQLCYWSDKKTQYTLTPEWIFGLKAVERWDKKGENWKYFVQLFLNKYEIERPVEYLKLNMTDFYDNIRSQNFGTDQGFTDCISGAFYSEKSKYCKKCEYEQICKNI